MPKIEIDFPDNTIFSTEITIHNTYINRGNHVGNSAYVDLCNEICLQFFAGRSVPEYTIGEQILLNTAFSVQLKSEAKFSDILKVDLAVDNFHRCGCDFVFRLSQARSGIPVALATFSFLTFDFQLGKVEDAAHNFSDFFDKG
jgi:4-hydroxybenzoyl-CoA thioesterase